MAFSNCSVSPWLTHDRHTMSFRFEKDGRSSRQSFLLGLHVRNNGRRLFLFLSFNQSYKFWCYFQHVAHAVLSLFAEHPSPHCVCLSRTVPHFFSVAYCQGLTLHNTLHTFCSDEPHGECVCGGGTKRHDVTSNQ